MHVQAAEMTKRSAVHLEWCEAPVRQFRTGVSLHSHTLHSEETLDFIYRLAQRVGQIRWILRQGEAKYRKRKGCPLDLRRAWWTPPCAPHAAWMVERNQIERRLQLNALVSLTDHDSIEAPLSLRSIESCRDVPVSFEWTVPYRETFLHLGLHNLPPDCARAIFNDLAAFTAAPDPARLPQLLEALSENHETLIVFNHPCWDEKGIGADQHARLAADFLRVHHRFLHALELNGLRPWNENRQAAQLARAFAKPVISGGDRHALEPNAILDLTNASTFAEYAAEVRSGWTNVLVTNHYREPFALRILQSLEEILQDHDDHARGWRRWSDRVFYQCDDGVTRPLTELFGREVPVGVQFFVKSIAFVRHCGARRTFSAIFPRSQQSRNQEFAL